MALIREIYNQEVLTSALENAKHHAKVEKLERTIEDMLFLPIDAAFVWTKTIQGEDFWRQISNELDSTNEYKKK